MPTPWVRANGVGLPLTIVGGGLDLRATRQLADGLGLASDVQFLGLRTSAEALALIHAGPQTKVEAVWSGQSAARARAARPKQRVERDFSVAGTVGAYERLFEELAQSRHRGGG